MAWEAAREAVFITSILLNWTTGSGSLLHSLKWMKINLVVETYLFTFTQHFTDENYEH